MIILYRDPDCKTVKVQINPKDIRGTSKTEDALDSYAKDHLIETMQKKIKELETCVQSQQRQLNMYANHSKSGLTTPELNKCRCRVDVSSPCLHSSLSTAAALLRRQLIVPVWHSSSMYSKLDLKSGGKM